MSNVQNPEYFLTITGRFFDFIVFAVGVFNPLIVAEVYMEHSGIYVKLCVRVFLVILLSNCSSCKYFLSTCGLLCFILYFLKALFAYISMESTSESDKFVITGVRLLVMLILCISFIWYDRARNPYPLLISKTGLSPGSNERKDVSIEECQDRVVKRDKVAVGSRLHSTKTRTSTSTGKSSVEYRSDDSSFKYLLAPHDNSLKPTTRSGEKEELCLDRSVKN